jgi:hypothetical protein
MVHRSEHSPAGGACRPPLLPDRLVLCAVIRGMLEKCCCAIVVTAASTGTV